MSLEQAIITLASAAAVAFMVLIAWLLGFRQRLQLSEPEMRALIAASEPDAAIEDIAIDEKGRAGLARLADGRWAAIASMGDRFALRVFPRARLTTRGGVLKARFDDAGFPALDLKTNEETSARLAGRA